MQPFCANCFKRDAKKFCGKCGCRYCSSECQKEHWKASHKQWCGVAGQWGRDYELKPSPKYQGRLGVFALRPFKKYETVAFSLDVTIGPGGEIPDLTDDGLSAGVAGRFNRISKNTCLWLIYINTDCLGNARILGEGPTTRTVKAVRDIAAGEEVSRPMADPLDLDLTKGIFHSWFGKPGPELPFQDRKIRQPAHKLLSGGSDWYCAACTNPAVDKKMGQLYASLLALDKIHPQPGLDVGKIKGNVKEMLALADELGCAPPVYFRIYSTLYNVMVSNSEHFTNQQGMKEILDKLKEISTEWYGPESEQANTIKECADSITEFPEA